MTVSSGGQREAGHIAKVVSQRNTNIWYVGQYMVCRRASFHVMSFFAFAITMLDLLCPVK